MGVRPWDEFLYLFPGCVSWIFDLVGMTVAARNAVGLCYKSALFCGMFVDGDVVWGGNDGVLGCGVYPCILSVLFCES